MTAFSLPKLTIRRKSDKARLEAATNLEDTSRGLVVPAQPAGPIRPSHGGLVQYYRPDEVGRSSSTSATSSTSDLSSVSSTPTSACSQFRHGKQPNQKAKIASTKKGSFSWKSGWHPDRKDDDDEGWRGGWPGSEHISEWRAHLRPAEQAGSSASSPSDSAVSFGAARSHASIESRTQSLCGALSTSNIDPSCFVGCQQVMPDMQASLYSAAWDRLPYTVEPPPYALTSRYELE